METKSPEIAVLTFDRAWKLYKVLQHCLSPVGIPDELEYMLEHMRPGTLMKCMNILFESYPDNLNSLEITVLVFKAMNANGFMQFVEVIRELSDAQRISTT